MFENFFRKSENNIDPEELKRQTQYIEKVPLVIKKPESLEIIEKLEKKLTEYESRMNDAKKQLELEPQNITAEEKYWDSMYKFVVVGNLLKNGEIIENEVSSALSEMHNGIKYPDRLSNAFKVVKAYVEGGEVVGGTGLK